MSSQTLPPSQGPEYAPCACGHIEPEHRPDAGGCLSCGCAAYRPATDQTPPADWIDGHPQLEAIAAAVWEQCGRSDSDTCVEDDPRNIAVVALAALLPAPADRAAVLTAAERKMLAYALDQAQERIWSEDGFTEEDQAAVTSLRRMADETQQPETEAAPDARPGTTDYTLVQRSGLLRRSEAAAAQQPKEARP